MMKGYSKSSKTVIDFGKNKMINYWVEEKVKMLFNLYKDLKLPEEYFQDIKWEFYEGDDAKGDILMEAEMTLSQFSKYLKVNIESQNRSNIFKTYIYRYNSNLNLLLIYYVDLELPQELYDGASGCRRSC